MICLPLNFDVSSRQFGEHRINAVLIDGAQRGRGQTQADVTILTLDPNLTTLQIRQKTPLRFVVCRSFENLRV